jgi:hypothetical protein
MGIALSQRTITLRLIEQVCQEVEQPFTKYDLTEAMLKRHKNFPTLSELSHILSRMPFLEVVGTRELKPGTVRARETTVLLYRYVGVGK